MQSNKAVKPFLVGITGGSGSGKTYFLNHLLKAFPKGDICLISQDNYYRPREEQPLDEEGVINFDTPGAIDSHAYAKDLAELKSGKSVFREEYTFNNPNKKPRMLEFKPAPIIVVEGIFVFHYPEIARLMDLKLFIDARDHLMLKRRIRRDNEERGYDLDDVLYRFEKHVAPAYDRYILPHRDEADLIIPNHANFGRALEVVKYYFEMLLDKSAKGK